MDRISNLPDEIICHIGSFLSAKEAAFAMILSKRWRNLFTIVPDLQFDGSVNNTESFKDFVDGVLALPVTSRIREFSLIWLFKDREHAHINRCLCHVLKLGVLVLDLRIFVDDDEVYSLPLEVFTCKTVAKLELGCFGFAIEFLPADAYLPALKSLCLNSVRFHFHEFGRCTFNTLLSAAPVLEELVMLSAEFEYWKWSFTVSSPTLKRLTIRRDDWGYESYEVFDPLSDELNNISFDTPGLIYLEYSNYVSKEYPFVNLNSLVEAKLNLCVDDGDYGRPWKEEHADDFDPMNLINALNNVEILYLSVQTMEMIYVYRKAIPVFENLLCVSVWFSNKFWLSLPILLKKSPNLKTLIIKSSLSDYDSEKEVFVCPDVLSCPVESLKINKYGGSIEELEQMKQFLEILSCLKLVEVHSWAKGKRQVEVMADLLMIPRASTKCKIQVTFY